MSSRNNRNGLEIENVFFVGLEEQYSLEELSFRHLRGKDRDVAFLFKNCQFLDVHLLGGVTHVVTVVRLKEIECLNCDNSELNCSRCKRTIPNTRSRTHFNGNVRWMDTKDASVHFDIQKLFEWPYLQSLSIDQQPTDRSSVFITKTRTPDGKFLVEKSYHYRHNIFVVWPKSQSSSITYCHGIHSLVNQWEQSMSNPFPPSADQDIQRISRGMTKVITLLCDETLRDWSEQVMESGNVIVKLLRLCTSLDAKKDGLGVLNLLAKDFGEDFEYAGLFNEEISEVVADFVSRITGSCIFNSKFYFEILTN